MGYKISWIRSFFTLSEYSKTGNGNKILASKTLNYKKFYQLLALMKEYDALNVAEHTNPKKQKSDIKKSIDDLQ